MTYTLYNGRPLEGSYTIQLYEPDGTPLTDIGETMAEGEGNVINTFKSLHYVRAINGMWAHGWGEYTIIAPMSQVSTKSLDLDTVVHINRRPPTVTTWRTDFYGMHRKSEVATDGDSLTYATSGFDLKHLLKRRVILPDDGSEPYAEGWYVLTSNVGAVYGIIPKEFDSAPIWRPRYYSAVCYEEAFDGDFNTPTPETIIIAGKHDGVLETQRYLYVGCSGRITGIRFTMGDTNDTQVATLWGQYYASFGWNTIPGIVDTTDIGGRPFAQDGTFTFSDPTDIIKGTGVQGGGFGDIYWYRFTLEEDGDSVEVSFTLKEVEVYGTPEVDTLRWASGMDHWTDIMRHLVRDQCITGTIAAGRQISYLTCEVDSHEGTWTDDEGVVHLLNLSYRYDNLSSILEEISGLGADWDVVETSLGHYQFQVYYNETGEDRTEDNTDGNVPVTFSLENGNIENPVFSDDRTSEITLCYAVGKLTNGKRKITPRTSIYGAQLASVWNRIEATSDSTTQDSEAAQLAAADNYLMENTQKIEVSFKFKQTSSCIYGVDWDLGDMVGFYFNNHYYEMRVTQVTIDVDENGETIVPTIVRLPSLDYLYT